MAFVKVANKDGVEAEFRVPIYEDDSEIKKSGNKFSYANDMLNQSIEVDNIPGERTIHYPVSFPHKLNGVFVTKAPGDLQYKISVYNANLDSFNIIIPPNEFSVKEKICLSATGY